MGPRDDWSRGCRNPPACSSIGPQVPAVPDVELRRILRLVIARSLNTFGRAVLNTTVGWELYERLHSKSVLAVVGLVQVIPVVALFVPAGTLVDRSDRRALATAAATVTGLIGLGLSIG